MMGAAQLFKMVWGEPKSPVVVIDESSVAGPPERATLDYELLCWGVCMLSVVAVVMLLTIYRLRQKLSQYKKEDAKRAEAVVPVVENSQVIPSSVAADQTVPAKGPAPKLSDKLRALYCCKLSSGATKVLYFSIIIMSIGGVLMTMTRIKKITEMSMAEYIFGSPIENIKDAIFIMWLKDHCNATNIGLAVVFLGQLIGWIRGLPIGWIKDSVANKIRGNHASDADAGFSSVSAAEFARHFEEAARQWQAERAANPGMRVETPLLTGPTLQRWGLVVENEQDEVDEKEAVAVSSPAVARRPAAPLRRSKRRTGLDYRSVAEAVAADEDVD